jgi:gamma-glutamyltranspeptidase
MSALRTSLGVVATETPESGRAAASILETGGNAVDAAIAGVFAVSVTRPDLCGIGGGGMLLVRMADGQTAMLDYREQALARDRSVRRSDACLQGALRRLPAERFHASRRDRSLKERLIEHYCG